MFIFNTFLTRKFIIFSHKLYQINLFFFLKLNFILLKKKKKSLNPWTSTMVFRNIIIAYIPKRFKYGSNFTQNRWKIWAYFVYRLQKKKNVNRFWKKKLRRTCTVNYVVSYSANVRLFDSKLGKSFRKLLIYNVPSAFDFLWTLQRISENVFGSILAKFRNVNKTNT